METGCQTLATAFAARLRRDGCAPGTVTKYRSAVVDYLSWWGRDPVEARRKDIEAYLDEWNARVDAKPGTVRVRMAALARFYDFLDSLGRLVDADGRELRNPLDRIKRPRSKKKANDWLEPDEDAAFLGAAITPEERIVIDLLRWTGLRVGEACTLTWRNVDFARSDLRVLSSKTDSGIRTVPICGALMSSLRAWERLVRERGLHRADGPVLVTKNHTPMKTQFVWRLVKRVAARGGVRAHEACDASGWNVSAVTPHTLRRTWATHLLNQKTRLEVVSKGLGHADTRVTQAHYAELLDETTRQEILEAMAS